ncbi:MAG: 6,7-dimethyl-8-ribityllumazine synthase [Thiotrichales bacterium]|nr:6,7-dimethyl-8-ribityllumazine synthase [Thiotrichales bacterium]OUX53161.1 MAG: 6,7-dimethyl-8-ribityllumazine synthase [Methylococcaceae bacterium TMED282]|tara:strand:+ start:183 stop:656 length:474 start_codon:yes stop_codon:yes gene_type:complete
MVKTNNISGGLLLDSGAKIGVICTRFNSFIVDHLETGCIDMLQRSSSAEIEVDILKVPGAYELPVVAKKMAVSNSYDAIIALGAVIRGATPHFEQVAGACSNGLSRVATDSGVPVIFGVLTVDTIEQAIERAGTKAGNKGAEAAATAIEMINLMRQV